MYCRLCIRHIRSPFECSSGNQSNASFTDNGGSRSFSVIPSLPSSIPPPSPFPSYSISNLSPILPSFFLLIFSPYRPWFIASLFPIRPSFVREPILLLPSIHLVPPRQSTVTIALAQSCLSPSHRFSCLH